MKKRPLLIFLFISLTFIIACGESKKEVENSTTIELTEPTEAVTENSRFEIKSLNLEQLKSSGANTEIELSFGENQSLTIKVDRKSTQIAGITSLSGTVPGKEMSTVSLTIQGIRMSGFIRMPSDETDYRIEYDAESDINYLVKETAEDRNEQQGSKPLNTDTEY